MFLCFDFSAVAQTRLDALGANATSDVGTGASVGVGGGGVSAAQVSAVIEWDLVARYDDVPTVDEVADYLSQIRPGTLSPPRVKIVDLPGGRGVTAHLTRARPEPDNAAPGSSDGIMAASWATDEFGTSLIEESLTVAVVNPNAGVATVTGTWLALHDGVNLAALVTAAAQSVRIGVHPPYDE